ncbi:MAG: uL30 family ribosomal protein [Candidatus Woesearchaeota archaeon]|nr:MAG: uL30 family ribosomal protein [Candidatus Woesearchaeota archaeon]
MPKEEGKLLLILVRGLVGLSRPIKDTLTFFRLGKKFTAVLVDDTPVTRGMAHKVKDYTTYGVVSDPTILAAFKDKKVLHLHPPRGGFERKGTKKPFTVGGVLGDRKEKIADLFKRMQNS